MQNTPLKVVPYQPSLLFFFVFFRISNCSTDSSHKQVFSFISTDSNETTECHAFLCSKRKLAETVTLAIAHAFSTAYEAWRILPDIKKFENNCAPINQQQQQQQHPVCENDNETIKEASIKKKEDLNVTVVSEEKLIDFGDEDFHVNADIQVHHEWVGPIRRFKKLQKKFLRSFTPEECQKISKNFSETTGNF